jgi:2-isopropylmalate synthase
LGLASVQLTPLEEEIVMAVRTRQDVFDCDSGLVTTQIMNCSKLNLELPVWRAAQQGDRRLLANAFAHESGIHQDGVLKALVKPMKSCVPRT